MILFFILFLCFNISSPATFAEQLCQAQAFSSALHVSGLMEVVDVVEEVACPGRHSQCHTNITELYLRTLCMLFSSPLPPGSGEVRILLLNKTGGFGPMPARIRGKRVTNNILALSAAGIRCKGTTRRRDGELESNESYIVVL